MIGGNDNNEEKVDEENNDVAVDSEDEYDYVYDEDYWE